MIQSAMLPTHNVPPRARYRLARHRRWHSAQRLILDTVFPPKCAGCYTRGHWLCPACLQKVHVLTRPLCGLCNQPVDPQAPHGCRTAATSLVSISAVGTYEGPLRAAIHVLKYDGRHGISTTLAALLAPRIADLIAAEDILIPVPLHPTRERERGYNQSFMIARDLADLQPLYLVRDALRRTRATRDQTQMAGAQQRASNVRDAFIADISLARDRRIWLLDDVYTTGATLRACADALRTAGAREVRGLVVARTGKY